MAKYIINGSMLRQYQLNIIKPILDGTKKHLFMVLPRRSGKSTLLFWLQNYLINKYYVQTGKPCQAAIFAPLVSQCRTIYVENILDDGRKLIQTSNAKFIESRLSLEYPFGSNLKLSSSDNVDNFIGASPRVVALDEYALGKPDAFDRLYPMVNYARGNFIISSTPRGKNHFYDLHQRFKDNPDWHVVHENVLSLGIMTQKEYDDIPMDENLKQQEFMTSYESPFQNAIYSQPNIKHINIDNNMEYILSIDLGQRDATSIIIAQVTYEQDINIIYSIEYYNQSLEDTLYFINKFQEDNNFTVSQWLVPHDTSQRDYITGRSRLSFLQDNNINTKLITRCGIMDGIELVRRKWHKIFFNTDTLAIERIKAYVTDANSDKPKHDGNSHMADALRYLALGVYDNDNDVEYSNYYNVKRK
jgi:hypothetical protein